MAGAGGRRRGPGAASARVVDDPARGRVARPDRAGGGRGAPAELRAAARARRLAAPGDDAADAAGPGVDRGGHRQAAVQERHPVRRRPTRRWPAHDALEVLPDYCYSHALVRVRVPARARPRQPGPRRRGPLWSLLGAQGVPRRRRQLVGDPAGARGAGATSSRTSSSARPGVGRRCRERRRRLAARGARSWRPPRRPRRRRDARRRRRRPGRSHGAAARRPGPCGADRAHEQIAAALDAALPEPLPGGPLRVPGRGRATTSSGTPCPRAFGDVSDDELQRYGGVLRVALRGGGRRCSAGRWRRSGPATCCSWCRASAWSR